MPYYKPLSPDSHIVIEVLPLISVMVEKLKEHHVVCIFEGALLFRSLGELVDLCLVHVFHEFGTDGKEEVKAATRISATKT